MARQTDLDRVLAAKRAELARLEKDIETLEQARALLRPARQEAARRARPVADTIRAVPRAAPTRLGFLAADSDAGRAVKVLETAKKPLHVNQIIEQMEQTGGTRVNRASLVGTLARYAKQGMHVYRAPAPNTFGLLAWKDRKMG